MKFTSEEFNTIKECKAEMKKIKEQTAKFCGYTRKEIVVPFGFVTLYKQYPDVKNNGNMVWLPVVSVIGEFPKWIDKKYNYRLETTEFYKKEK